MAQVTIRINGFAYTIGCKDGEEEHLLGMASEVDQRIESIKSTAGPSGEARMLVMAALLLADDLFEKDKLLLAAKRRFGGAAARRAATRRRTRSWVASSAGWPSVRKRLPRGLSNPR